MLAQCLQCLWSDFNLPSWPRGTNRPWWRRILLPSITRVWQFDYSISQVTLPAVVDNHWKPSLRLYSEIIVATHTAHDALILRNQPIHIFDRDQITLDKVLLEAESRTHMKEDLFFMILRSSGAATDVGSIWLTMVDRVPHCDKLLT